MRRIHAFEFNDRTETPRPVREAIVETLGAGLRWGRIYDGVGPVFAEFCQAAGAREVLDLCSGSGEPVSILLEALKRAGSPLPRFATSDLHPNVPAMRRAAARWGERVAVIEEPVDAAAVQPEHDRPARTVISAFHHFTPELAARILADAVAKRRAIFVLEPFDRSLRALAVIPAMVAGLLANPWVARRDRAARALLTYALPAIPLAGAWDFVVSVLREHTREELLALVAPLDPNYRWEYREVPFFPAGRAVAFYGVPRAAPRPGADVAGS